MRVRPFFSVSLLLTTLAVVAVLMPARASAADPEGSPRADRHTLTITQQQRDAEVVPREIIGANMRWLNTADGAWDPKKNRLRKDVARQVRRIGIGSIRYPGGTIANVFNFRNALGQPGCQVSGGLLRPAFAPISPDKSEYTIGRHAQFARMAGAGTNIMIPMINTTPAEAVAYVKAMSQATGQKKFYVEVGNEPFLTRQRYWRAKPLATRLNDYILGGTRMPDGMPGDHSVYPVTGCNLMKPATAVGGPDQTYRPRYTPIAPGTKPKVTVVTQNRTDVYEYVPTFSTCGLLSPQRREYTISADRTRIIFAPDRGLLSSCPRPPKGAEIKISYQSGPNPGFTDFFGALKNIPGIDVEVCSSWASVAFVERMNELNRDYDCIAVHSYANIGGPTRVKMMYNELMKAARSQNARLAYLRSQMRTSPYPGAENRYFNVTEFGGQHYKKSGLLQSTFMREIVQGIHLVAQINQGVRVSNLSNFRALFEHFGGRVTLSGRGYLLGLVRHLVGEQPMIVAGTPKGTSVAATRDGRQASLLVVNASWDKDRKTSIALPGRKGAMCVAVRTLRTDPDASTRPRNASGRPLSVRAPRSLVWKKDVEKFKYNFQSHSISLLTFRPRTGPCGKVGPL